MNLSVLGNISHLAKSVSFFSLVFFFITFLNGCVFEGIDPPVVTGQFNDSPVQGLTYNTGSQSGTTDAEGNFNFKRREEIGFTIGGVYLGTAIDKFTVTPVDLVSGAVDDSDPAVLKICRFLQSLDEDGNPANGIKITPQITELLVGYDTDIEDLTEAMMQDIIDILNAAGVFSANTPRQLVTVAAAHDHFLQYLATVDSDKDRFDDAKDCNDIDRTINPGAAEICGDGIDQDCDGSDLICPPPTTSTTTTSTSTTTTTTIPGNTTTTTTITASTTTTTSTTTTLPSSGNWVLTESLMDEDNDGVMDEHRYYYYDDNQAKNNPLYDLGMLTADRWNREERDWSADGSIDLDSYYSYTYDSRGRLETITKDEYGSGTIDSVYYYTYAGNGNLAREWIDTDNDGIIEELNYFTIDENGKLVSAEGDEDNDGIIDAFISLNYDTNGNWTSLDVDDDNNGSVDAVIHILYDGNGNWQSWETDEGLDGTIETVEYYYWKNLATTTNALTGPWILNPDSLADSAVITFIDDKNYIIAVEGDPDGSGGRGMERGVYTWNPSSGAFTANILSSTAGDRGLSDIQNLTVSPDGKSLNLIDSSNGITSLMRVTSATQPVIGSWLFSPGSLADSAVVSFIDAANYMFVVDGEPDDGGGRGMERGTYTWNSSTGIFTPTAISGTVGDWGLSGSSYTMTISADGSTLNLIHPTEGLLTFTKVQ